MLRRLLCILLTLCLLLGYAAAEDSATATPTQEPPAGALVNGMVDGAGETAVQELQERLIAWGCSPALPTATLATAPRKP